MPLPDFLIMGAPKSGTTALHVALSEHPQLFLSAVKEPKFFMTDGAPPTRTGPGAEHSMSTYIWQQHEYEELFASAPPGTLCGESTTVYLSDLESHRRIRDLVPHARLIAVLRDPVDRAHSNWMHNRSIGLERERDFRVACSLEEERHRAGWSNMWFYFRHGRYGEQVEHLYQLFPPEQVLLVRYRDLRNDPEGTVSLVCTFLGVDTDVIRSVPALNVTAQASDSAVDETLRRVMRLGSALAYKLPGRIPERIGGSLGTSVLRLLHRQQKMRSPMTREERCALIPAFAPDIALLERTTGMSFQDWLDPDNDESRSPLSEVQEVGATFNSIDRPISTSGSGPTPKD